MGCDRRLRCADVDLSGDCVSGVQLCRYMDTVRSTAFLPGATGKLCVFKVMKVCIDKKGGGRG